MTKYKKYYEKKTKKKNREKSKQYYEGNKQMLQNGSRLIQRII